MDEFNVSDAGADNVCVADKPAENVSMADEAYSSMKDESVCKADDRSLSSSDLTGDDGFMEIEANSLYGSDTIDHKSSAINKDIEPKEYEVKNGDNLTKIAKEQLGPDATPEQVKEHVDKIATLNDVKNPNMIKTGEKLSLPGYTADGGFVVLDEDGNKTTAWDDGTVKQEKTDGTGSVIKADGSEHHWGPKEEDNYDITSDGGKQTTDADGNKKTVWADHTERIENKDGTGYVKKPGLDATGNPDGTYEEHHWGPKESDNYDLKKNADGSVERTDKPESKDHSDLGLERTRLDDKAKEKLTPAEYESFKENMKKFEDRAAKDGVKPEEVAKTFHEVNRIFSAEGNNPLSPQERNKAAREVMENAADPTAVDQGFHNTCNVTTVETRLYTKHPADAAKLVADVATTGKYKTASGVEVEVPAGSLRPDREANQEPVPDGQRNYASQIFQITAVNIQYANEGKGIKYEQHPIDPNIANDTGERLVDYSEDPPEMVDKNSFVWKAFFGADPERSPGLSNAEIVDVSNEITGLNEKDFFLVADSVGSSDKTVKVTSEQDLKDKLEHAKAEGKMPLVVYVDAANEPFLTDSGGGTAGGSNAAHVVTVTDYDPETGKVTIDNQWGKRSDHEAGSEVSAHDLYLAMGLSNDSDTVELWEKDVEYNREHDQIDGFKELQLKYLKNKNSDLDDEDYDKEIVDFMKESKDRWAQQEANGTLDANEKARTEAKYNQMVNIIRRKDADRAKAIEDALK